jgi:hypothetical protein
MIVNEKHDNMVEKLDDIAQSTIEQLLPIINKEIDEKLKQLNKDNKFIEPSLIPTFSASVSTTPNASLGKQPSRTSSRTSSLSSDTSKVKQKQTKKDNNNKHNDEDV